MIEMAWLAVASIVLHASGRKRELRGWQCSAAIPWALAPRSHGGQSAEGGEMGRAIVALGRQPPEPPVRARRPPPLPRPAPPACTELPREDASNQVADHARRMHARPLAAHDGCAARSVKFCWPAHQSAVGGEGEAVPPPSRHGDDALVSEGLDLLRQQLVLLVAVA